MPQAHWLQLVGHEERICETSVCLQICMTWKPNTATEGTEKGIPNLAFLYFPHFSSHPGEETAEKCFIYGFVIGQKKTLTFIHSKGCQQQLKCSYVQYLISVHHFIQPAFDLDSSKGNISDEDIEGRHGNVMYCSIIRA